MFLIILLSLLGIFGFKDFSSFIPKAEFPNINRPHDDFCPCRLLESERYWEICWLLDWDGNDFGVDHIANHSILFDDDRTYVCNYLYGVWSVEKIDVLFPEAREECTPLWVEADVSHTFHNSSTTISFDGKYVIPYCYGMKNLYIYEIRALDGPNDGEFLIKKILTFKDKVEAVRFFKDYLIVLDAKKIIAYSMKKGKEFKKIGEFPLEHRLYTPLKSNPEYKIPTLMRAMEMDGDYLYILNPPGNDYGPLLTFKISDERIELLNDGNSFRASFHEYPYVWRFIFWLNETHNKKYLYFQEYACGNKYCFRNPMLRLENGILYPVEEFNWESTSSDYCSFIHPFYVNFQNEFFYAYIRNEEFCGNRFSYFTEDEKLVDPIVGEQVYDYPTWSFGKYKGSDTELWQPNGRIVSCSTDGLPTVEYIIAPEEASQNFLLMGRAYDSEGIRRVFAGFPLEPFFIRANVFQQEDGSVLFMAILPERDFYWNGTECSQEKPYTIEAIAEDIDGDTNESPDISFGRDFLCLSFKEEKDPLPIGEVEMCPFEYAKSIYINGWALDNNGIKGGWLFSEDANVLIPINYGKERQDIKDKYPEYPDSLHSGFEVQYDLSNLEEGEYEFYVRIMAKDYQVIDFGPYKITIPKHKRPF